MFAKHMLVALPLLLATPAYADDDPWTDCDDCASRDWIYPHEERERLREYGLTLEDISPATLLKEEHYFYQCACRATERLYLSRPLMLVFLAVPLWLLKSLLLRLTPAQSREELSAQDVAS